MSTCTGKGRLPQGAFGPERTMRLTVVKTLRIHYTPVSSPHPAVRSSHESTTCMSFEAVSRLFTLDWSLVDLAKQFCGLISQARCFIRTMYAHQCNVSGVLASICLSNGGCLWVDSHCLRSTRQYIKQVDIIPPKGFERARSTKLQFNHEDVHLRCTIRLANKRCICSM